MAGRPRFVPTKDQSIKVAVWAACGTPQKEIARRIDIDHKTLRKAFREELDGGKDTANAMVAQSLFKRATGDGPQSVTAAIFWLKSQAGWRDAQAFEVSAPNGGVFVYMPENGR